MFKECPWEINVTHALQECSCALESLEEAIAAEDEKEIKKGFKDLDAGVERLSAVAFRRDQ